MLLGKLLSSSILSTYQQLDSVHLNITQLTDWQRCSTEVLRAVTGRLQLRLKAALCLGISSLGLGGWSRRLQATLARRLLRSPSACLYGTRT